MASGRASTASAVLIAWNLAAAFLLGGCATPAQRVDGVAADLGLRRVVVAGAGFDHVAYLKGEASQGTLLRIYLGGDGTPYAGRGRPAPDPTPRNPLTLRLMARDPAPAIFLGRPCYHGFSASPGCPADLWTRARYSETVVASMAAAMGRLVPDDTPVVLVGYSGGGVLAMLLAERLPRVAGVLTVAANLDLAAWTRVRDLGPLTGSLDPAFRPPLDPVRPQVHLAGAQDRIVPPAVTRSGARRQPAAKVVVLAGHDHVCCWERHWSDLLGHSAGW